MRFEVAVGEGEIDAAVVVGTGQVAQAIVQAVDEEAVVECVGMFIQEDEDARGVAISACLEELDIERVETVGQFAGVAHLAFMDMLRMRGPFGAGSRSAGHL